MIEHAYSAYDYILVVDLEATCSNDDSVPRKEMETIEIGAVMVSAETLQPIGEYQAFVRPVRHPQLTLFCQQLTSIAQETVDAAATFPQVAANFTFWLEQFPNHLFGSWGAFDRKLLLQDAKFHAMKSPIDAKHVNLRKLFTREQRLHKQFSMSDALRMANIPFIGSHHRGIDDARNIAKLLPFILGWQQLDR